MSDNDISKDIAADVKSMFSKQKLSQKQNSDQARIFLIKTTKLSTSSKRNEFPELFVKNKCQAISNIDYDPLRPRTAGANPNGNVAGNRYTSHVYHSQRNRESKEPGINHLDNRKLQTLKHMYNNVISNQSDAENKAKHSLSIADDFRDKFRNEVAGIYTVVHVDNPRLFLQILILF
jgi:hypothetical protein